MMSGFPVSSFSCGVALESTCGTSPDRSNRYRIEHSAQRPVAGQVFPPAATTGAAEAAVEPAAFGGGDSFFEHALSASADVRNNVETSRMSPEKIRRGGTRLALLRLAA